MILMCGICGVVVRDRLQDTSFVSRMEGALTHRGPDGSGVFEGENVMLAVRRLSIIDLTTGWQPLYNEDKSLALICNGEIYNYIELTELLQSKGHTFRTHSDCETILHLYEEYGEDCVQHLRGMFAFALWDTREKSLLLARDRLGEKPLYLYEQDGFILFASEMKSLLSSGRVPFRLDASAIDLYFHYQYVPEPFTPLEKVRKLPAAHRLLIRPHNWEIKEDCYWKIEDSPAIDGDPAQRIREELESVSRIIVRSDVPIGIALSGGIDSSAVAAFISKSYPGQLQAFTVGYPGHPPYDERKDASAISDFLKIPFYEIEIRTEEMVTFFPELVWSRDDPIADISGYGYYAVMKLAGENGVPVMMQGQGGDELFWGYPWVQRALEDSLLKERLVKTGNRAFFDYLELIPPTALSPWGLRQWIGKWFGLREGLQKFRHHKTIPDDQYIFYDLLPDFRNAVKETSDLYTKDFSEKLNGNGPWSLFKRKQPGERQDIAFTRMIYQTYLLENGIAQGDRLSMASSVELRLPLLDYKLVETVIGLRKNNPDHRLPPKAWLKDAIRGMVPDWILSQPKRGFQPPVHDWHRALFETYSSHLIDGYLQQNKILKEEAAVELSRGNFKLFEVSPMSFKALVLETWCRKMTS